MAFDWLGAGYLRRKRESPGGFASTQSGGDSVPGKPSLIPGAGSETGSDFFLRSGFLRGILGASASVWHDYESPFPEAISLH